MPSELSPWRRFSMDLFPNNLLNQIFNIALKEQEKFPEKHWIYCANRQASTLVWLGLLTSNNIQTLHQTGQPH